MSAMNCNSCGERYKTKNVKVLGHADYIWFLNVYCSDCHSQALITAVIKEGKPPEIITDLTKSEIAKFTQSSTIGTDDILDTHSFLNDFDGDFIKLFCQK